MYLVTNALVYDAHGLKQSVTHTCNRISFHLHAAPKPKPKQLSKNAEYYIMMKEFRKAKEDGMNYDQLKQAIANKTGNNGGYQRFVGKNKGTLDQRLRAIINYKNDKLAADYTSTGMTSKESSELEEFEDYDDAEDEYTDDEERIYESAVLDILKKSKMQEIQQKMAEAVAVTQATSGLEKAVEVGNNDNHSTNTSDATNSTKASIPDDELYTPSRSSWGVFQRPKDISKTYGGGRVITKEDIKAMDLAYEESLKKQKETQFFLTEEMRREDENKEKIRDALARGRGCLQFGNRKGAVIALEAVRPFLSWQSELGGEVLLELAMALETVDRSDEARAMYGKLASVSWSQTVRRNAVQLLEGLDITKKLRQDGVTTTAPIVDLVYMQSLSEQLKVGLTNEWNDYKKKDKRNTKSIKRWFEDDDVAVVNELERVRDLRSAYYLLLRALNPLKKIPSESLRRACRMLYIASDTDKREFVEVIAEENAEKPEKPLSLVSPQDRELSAMSELELFYQSRRKREETATPEDIGSIFGKSVNGSWELVLSVKDAKETPAKLYEAGAVRRLLLLSKSNGTAAVSPSFNPSSSSSSSVQETVPVFWGMDVYTRSGPLAYNPMRQELTTAMREEKSSVSPWQKAAASHTVQVIWANNEIMVTREVASDSIRDPDLYTVWKRLKPVLYKKY